MNEDLPMGFRCRWIAVRGRERNEVLAELGFAVKTRHDEPVYDTGLFALELAPWLVVMGDGWDFMDLVTRDQAARLSKRGEALFLHTDDSPMACELTSYVAGERAWSLTYDGSHGRSTPQLEGALPAAVTAALAELTKEQQESGDDDVDYLYDVAATAGLRLVGFRHDQTLSSGERLPVYELTAR